MKVGLYFDVRNPTAWRQDWHRLYSFTLEVCEEADRLGADSLWFSEHHLFEDGYLAQPLTFMAAAAARTKRSRLGTAILVAPLRNVVHTAEEATVVDLISDGRVDLGIGTGYRQAEADLFGASLEGKYAQTDEFYRELKRLWSDGVLTPPPVGGDIPVWMGYQGPQGARRAGLLGAPLLCTDPKLFAPYSAGLREGGHEQSSARMAGAMSAFITNDPDRDWPVVSRHLAWQLDTYRAGMVDGPDKPAPVDPERLRSRGLSSGLGGILVDTPEVVAARIKDFVGTAPVETVYFWVSLAGMPEEMVMRHATTILTELKPLLKDA